MTTITTSLTLTADILATYTWPVIINSGVTITLGSNINLTSNSQYFIIGGSNVIFDGSIYKINLSSITNYAGLFQNNTLSYTNIILQNINMLCNGSTMIDDAAWICQSGFLNGQVKFSKTNGQISSNSGGIFGQGCYNCVSTNNYTSGTIETYGGGIFGSYCVNCSCSESYTSGPIGNYSGGIFGFGTNYIYNGISYSPSDILDQSGNQIINPPTFSNNYGTVTTCTVSNSYSLGSIGQYAGGIFGYFAYKCLVSNCYSAGNGNNSIPYTSGGIYAMNFYSTSGIYYPSATNCSASNCYTSGSFLTLDGIFSFTNTNITTNTKTSCFSEQYNNPCVPFQVFNNYNACTVLQQIGQVWLVPDLCKNASPFILASFTKPLYDCNFKKIKHCDEKTSEKGNYPPSYYILDVNCCLRPSSITINHTTGKLNFDKVKCGEYAIRVLNGGKNYIISGDNIAYSITYVDYNVCIYYLKSK
jgi:hypothetical protein